MAHQLAHRAGQTVRAPSTATLVALQSAISSLTISSPNPATLQRRNASHQAQGRANGPKDRAGKRLGAKKTGGEYVIPGNILYRQRGTLWFPGDGCFMGRDHTIHAKVPGYVKFYRDPSFPTRKYIGVVFERNNVLPQPPNAVRKRLLGMLAYRMPENSSSSTTSDPFSLPSPPTEAPSKAVEVSTQPPSYPQTATVKNTRENGEVITSQLKLRSGSYQWRQANYEIGRAALQSERALKVKPYDPNDRFLAWRKRNARRARAAQKRALGRGGKGAAKGKAKGRGKKR